MKLAFIVFTYFPYGGMQRNLINIGRACLQRGHEIIVYTSEWQGRVPDGFQVEIIPVRASTNHGFDLVFSQELQKKLQQAPVDMVVGFNRMPGLDCYYAGDFCYAAKIQDTRNVLYKYLPRSRHRLSFEKAVFGEGSKTQVLLVSEQEKQEFQRFYKTAEERFYLLPPGIGRDRVAPVNAAEIRNSFRQQSDIGVNEKLLLALGSGFKTKGVDRSIRAVAALPKDLKEKAKLFVVGQDKARGFERLAKKLGVADQVVFFSGRDDVAQLLLGADLLVHPAYRENTGNVLLEAMVAGLPVAATDVCGYAHYVLEAQMGEVLSSPFDQSAFNAAVVRLLNSPKQDWEEKGKAFAETADIYSRAEHAADEIERIGRELKCVY